MDLTNKHRIYLINYAAKHLTGGDRLEAEDLAQEAFLRAWKARDKYEEKGKLMQWLITIIRRSFFNKYNKNKRDIGIAVNYSRHMRIIERTYTTQSHIDDLSMPMQSCFDDMNKKYLDVIELRAKDLSYIEISEELGCPVGTVMSRLSRGRIFFKEHTGYENANDVMKEYKPDNFFNRRKAHMEYEE